MKLSDYVREYSRSIPDTICDYLMKLIDESEHSYSLDSHEFLSLNINQHYPELLPALVEVARHARQRYEADVDDFKSYIESRTQEEFRVKKYDVGKQFRKHVDASSLATAPRALAFLFYLNDDFGGGGTRFSHKVIKPQKGKVVVFPPNWMFPHAGLPVTSGQKYIMSTYVHLEEDDTEQV